MTLIPLRQQIDEIDMELIRLLARRQAVSTEIGKVKKMNDVPVTDPAREEEALRMRGEFAEQHGLTTEEAEQFFQVIFEMSKGRQES